MKRLIMLFLILGVLSYGYPGILSVTDQSTNGVISSSSGDNFLQLDIRNQVIPTGSANFISFKFDRVLDWDALYIPAVTSGGDAITTANIDYLLLDDTIISSNTMTVGTVWTETIASQRIQIKMYNPSGNVETTVTTSIQAWND